jgi:hypothetical protein
VSRAALRKADGYSYGDNVFYRLRQPLIVHGEEGLEDWQIDVADLSKWLRSVNSTTGFKVRTGSSAPFGAPTNNYQFVLSPKTLAPWFGGSHTDVAWREAVLDVLSGSVNVIVLAESSCRC